MFKQEITYGYGDVCIMTAVTSGIEHRSDCLTRKDGMLPIFAAPMSTVISVDNYKIFQDNGIIPIIPRNVSIDERLKLIDKGLWVSLSLNEFGEFVKANDTVYDGTKICIDLAKGNLENIFELSSKAKDKYGDSITLMSGNIDNPETYKEYCKAGIDYCRIGIGGGAGCLTTANCGIHKGIATLINEAWTVKQEISWSFNSVYNPYRCLTKIVADGGIRNYDSVIKALALGADYVMIGGLLASLIESAAETFYEDETGKHNLSTCECLSGKIREEGGEIFHIDRYYTEKIPQPKKCFYGMASKKGQIDLFGSKKRTSEGKEVILDCTTNVDKWCENMNDSLASAMSYCDIDDVLNFNPHYVETRLLSPCEQKAINK